VSFTVYSNAFRGFDRERREARFSRGCRCDHHLERAPKATPDALAKTWAFLERRLKG